MNRDQQKTILLVEDEALIAILEKKILEKYGYKVISAYTGEMAVQTANETPGIDLILMDINLGKDMDGTQAAIIILEKHNIPLIFLSSHTEREIVEKTEGITSYGYIDKSSGETVLIASIKMAFRLFESQLKEKEKEIALKQNEFFLYKAQEIGKIGHFSIDPVTNIIEGSPEFFKIFNLDCNQPLLKSFITAVHPEDRHLIISLIEKAKDGVPYDIEHRVFHKDRTILFVHTKGEILNTPNGIRIVGIVQDITERKLSEEAFLENEKKLREAQNMAHLGFWSWDIKTGKVEWSDEVYKIFCLNPKEFMPHIDSILAMSPWPEDHQRDKELIDRAIKTHNPGYYEQKFLRPDKSIGYYYSTFQGKYDENDNLISIIGTVLDITERKQDEKALRESQERFRLAFDNANIGMCLVDTQGKLFKVNKEMCEMFGYTKEEFEGMTVNEIAHPDYLEVSTNFIQQANSGEIDHSEFEKAYIHKQGHVVWGQVSSSLIRNSKGEPSYFISHVHDITERKLAEDNLKKIMTLLEQSFEQSPVPMVLVSMPDAIVKIINPACKEFLGIIDEPSYIGTSLFEYIPTYQDFDTNETLGSIKDLPLARALRGEKTINEERHIVRKDGTTRWELVSSAPICNAQGDIIAGYIVMIDITERKLAEDKIKNLLAEKELILKEVHHRIKNNMNTIAGLLFLHAGILNDPLAIAALNDAGSRIQSMMVLYDKLYQSVNFNEMLVIKYLPAMIKNIVKNFPNNESVKIETHIEEFTLDSKRISVLGLIINELITNIMKYAFSGRDNGLIKVYASLKERHVSFVIQDNGIGIPESINFENSKGFGLILVGLLTKQLEGTIRIERKKGTKIILEFEIS